ncbi:hypothetical protein [Wenzhouxiangella limi]|uniref:Lipoprotein n=1 Tax=Wenzhouxiangella limi TaxID=2707351 RepID=A0A845UV39_9GAMM|nr:hypothetical protein [Wenzhouxiangella limi]NDY94438.1 hypothetical protein [Wenzhouxiangella limi]
MRTVIGPTHSRRIRFRAGRRVVLAAVCLATALMLTGCSSGGVYANVGIAGPTVNLGPVSVRTGVNIGRWL